MSKKKFTSGMDDIFAGSSQQSAEREVMTNDYQSAPTMERKAGSKRFVTTLDSLLAEISDDPFFSEPQNQSQARPGKSKTSQNSGYRAPVTGLDALIRQTLLPIDGGTGEMDDETKRRISVIVDKSKLDRLKTIARMEGAFMKDIISDLIETYVHKYVKEKGVDI
jgi:hypothetical protein